MNLNETIANLRQLTQKDVQHNWHYSQDLNLTVYSQINPYNWAKAQVNEKGYITWLAGNEVLWLAQEFVIPTHLNNYPLEGLALRLVLTWWAESAQVLVNGTIVQEGDLFDSTARILLTPSAIPGEKILVTIRLVSPGHDLGAMMKSQAIYESSNYADIDPGFVADELTILGNYIEAFEPEKIDIFSQKIENIDWNQVANRQNFNQSLNHLRHELIPLAKKLKQRCFNLLGHAHLDMAWLWTTSETYTVAKRTFFSVLNLQQDYPNLTFGHTTSALYFWIEKNEPELFTFIQEAVKLGQWEILGGMWVEPEVNLTAGESIIRQLLYGQRYNQSRFGSISKVAWLPDSFGFSWQLPQIFKQSGIEYFVTGKLHWNDTTKFPYPLFWWQAPDGTKLLTLMSPPNVAGVMDTNPITMVNYALDWEKQTGLKDIFWLPGVGDHGGGPTRDMLEVQARWQNSSLFPDIQFTTAYQYLNKITDSNKDNLPIWNDELYLEFHRGCYTTHADQKKFNRSAESLLYQAELFTSIENLIEDKLEIGDNSFKLHRKEQLENLWKKVLFNQFHDILPGTSITDVFLEANQQWQEVISIGENILQECLQRIATKIILPDSPHPNAQPIFIFNPLNWQRSEVVKVKVELHHNWRIYDLHNNSVPTQESNDYILFIAENIPSLGYSVYWLVSQNKGNNPKKFTNYLNPLSENNYILENKNIRVVINQKTGDIERIFDKVNKRLVLKGLGNQIQAFKDERQYWDAWNINPNYRDYPLENSELQSITWLDKGPIQWSIRVIRKFRKSLFTQDYILEGDSPILKIVNHIDWLETHTLVKAAFPLNFQSDYATCEIACGAITHPTKPETEAEKAKWEVSALRWADLSNDDYGVSILNDCKYGYDIQPNQLRLTLLRSPIWPDPFADKGTHEFTYAVYPHLGSWQTAKTVQKGYELNIPLQVFLGDKISREKTHSLPSQGSFLDLQADNLILMALKLSEDDSQKYILRCYECHGESTVLSLAGDLGLQLNQSVDLLENNTDIPTVQNGEVSISPWQIVSFSLDKFD